jgi:hypothetical protein
VGYTTGGVVLAINAMRVARARALFLRSGNTWVALTHDLREVSDRLDGLADVLQFPEVGEVTVDEVPRELMDTVGQTRSTVTGIARAAESVAYAS